MKMVDGPFAELPLEKVKDLVESGDYDVVDVREGWEYQRGHLPGARNVVLASILGNPNAHRFKDKTVFVCEVGERSAVASEMATALGTRDVVNFRGGTRAWRDAGLPLEK
jgi:rhodanese-related sulfurtransferase